MVEITEKFKSKHNPDISYEMPLQMVLSRPLQDIDLFIGHLTEHHPGLVESFVNGLISKLQSIVLDPPNLDIFEFDPENLGSHPELEQTYKNAILELLDYQRYSKEVTDGKAVFVFRDVLRSYLIPAAHIAETIMELIPGNEGIEFYHNYVDYRTDHEKKLQPKEDLEAFYESIKSMYQENALEQSFYFEEGGALYSKVTFCLWKEIMKEFDPIIGYAVACHFDFNAAKHFNENFILTRTKTVMEGNEFCDFCWWDTRLGSKSHPDDEFWDSLD